MSLSTSMAATKAEPRRSINNVENPQRNIMACVGCEGLRGLRLLGFLTYKRGRKDKDDGVKE